MDITITYANAHRISLVKIVIFIWILAEDFASIRENVLCATEVTPQYAHVVKVTPEAVVKIL